MFMVDKSLRNIVREKEINYSLLIKEDNLVAISTSTIIFKRLGGFKFWKVVKDFWFFVCFYLIFQESEVYC